MIINSLGRLEEREDHRTYVSSRSPCIVAHAIEEDAPGAAQESRYLGKIRGVSAAKCMTTTELMDLWNHSSTGVVHFSSHNRFDKAMKEYVMTLSNGQIFRSMTDRPRLKRASLGLPFLFLNACNTGSIFPEASDTFVNSLCPMCSAGVVSTIHGVGGADAASFAKKYYENWVAGEYAIDALGRTKHSFIYDRKDFSAITYEVWEMPEEITPFAGKDDEGEIDEGQRLDGQAGRKAGKGRDQGLRRQA